MVLNNNDSLIINRGGFRSMSKLTLKQIQTKINDIESKYYKGWRQSEEWWRVSGDVHPIDRGLWSRYTKLLTTRKEEEEANE
tara:strand:- start:247 stop:492 length:246 start_codon:yes stop_codon:yes gene_type:complete